LKVGKDGFEAYLLDPSKPSIVEHAEFLKRELSTEVLSLLRPGAVFYWMIGYRDKGSRERVRESVIWMRRSGRMTPEKFDVTLQHIEDVWGTIAERSKPTATAD
jgi:hypothetical protein